MRLDKYLCEMKIGTRSQVKDFIRQGLVTVNGAPAGLPDMKIEESADRVCFRGRSLNYRKHVYYMLNKPWGVVSAVRDAREQTVISLLDMDERDGVFPVGRLDKDATGLLLLTDDGELAHRLLSPRKHVEKVYQVHVDHPLAREDISRLEHGLDIGEEKPTLPAKVSVLGGTCILLTLHEGRFHQVKRMLTAVGNRVTALKRVSFGGLPLDEGLEPGKYRELTEEEIELLRDIRQGGGRE